MKGQKAVREAKLTGIFRMPYEDRNAEGVAYWQSFCRRRRAPAFLVFTHGKKVNISCVVCEQAGREVQLNGPEFMELFRQIAAYSCEQPRGDHDRPFARVSATHCVLDGVRIERAEWAIQHLRAAVYAQMGYTAADSPGGFPVPEEVTLLPAVQVKTRSAQRAAGGVA